MSQEAIAVRLVANALLRGSIHAGCGDAMNKLIQVYIESVGRNRAALRRMQRDYSNWGRFNVAGMLGATKVGHALGSANVGAHHAAQCYAIASYELRASVHEGCGIVVIAVGFLQWHSPSNSI